MHVPGGALGGQIKEREDARARLTRAFTQPSVAPLDGSENGNHSLARADPCFTTVTASQIEA